MFFSRKTLSPSRIPASWDDVTPDWMTAAIAPHCPGAVVKTATIITRDDGTNRRARFALTYAAGSGPARLFLKAHAARNRWVHFRNGNLFNEARLFQCGIKLPVDHPFVYKALTDLWRLDFLLVMEDITQRGADPRDATRPMTPEQVANGLRGLARLHSQYWGINAKTHPKLAWLKTWEPTQGWQVGLKKRIPTGLDRAKNFLPAALRHANANDIVANWARYVRTLSKAPVTLLHADSHIGNIYVLPNNDVGFLDFQVVRRGRWSQDVGHFLIGALTEEDRRAHEAELIEIYRNALTIPEDQRPTKEQAFLEYRASVIYGLTIWLSTLGTDGWQDRAICDALAQRFATAYAELDTLTALNQICLRRAEALPLPAGGNSFIR